MVAKVAGGIIGLGLIGTGGVAFVKPEWFGMDYMPNFHALSKDTDYGARKADDYKDDKFGGKYKNYLVGVTKKSNNKDSQAWWEWSYRKLKSDGVDSGKFKVTGVGDDKKVDKAYGEKGDDKALNQVCKAAYKTTNGTGSFEDENTNPSSGTKFKKSEIWKYCSPLGKEPEKINKNNYENQIGSEDESFISVEKGANTLFWFIRDKEIRSEGDNFEKITVTPAASSGTSNHFQQQGKSLRELCEEAYKTPKTPTAGSSTNNLTKDEVKKYCAFEISAST